MIEIACVVIVFMQGILIVLAYRQGLKDRTRVENEKDLEPIIKQARKKIERESDADKRTATILKNIDNYGTKNPQEKVK